MSSDAVSTSGAPLRLHALDAEDLAHISAHLQDALLRICDMTYLAKQRRFALVAARFDWEAQSRGVMERSRVGAHFDGVRAARIQGLRLDRPQDMLELLTIGFEPGEHPPAGDIRLSFAGGATVLLEVECVEAQLSDLGERWAVSSPPTHET